ncbi:response regulator [Vibrio hippocampi]|uniref:Sensor histidine kinase RcsC n=1 Tax=Vibrio hippocampi TaxID=654686 RepID=A0ABN8DI31_9VIBR|nr:response regulator [Vibrio hippocampi]CAH0526076.1 Sensor histidine kinase RcsC [Vibrio hippocampi]
MKAAKPIDCEIINYHKDGSEYWIDISISPVFENGELVKFIAVERDITQRKQLEIKLQTDRNLALSESEQSENLFYLLNYFVVQQNKLALKGMSEKEDTRNSREHLELLESVRHHVAFMASHDKNQMLSTPIALQSLSQSLSQDFAKFATKMEFAYSGSIDDSVESLLVAGNAETLFRFAFHLAMLIALTHRPDAMTLQVKASVKQDKVQLQLEFIVEDHGQLLELIQKLVTSDYDSSSRLMAALEYAHRKAVTSINESHGQVTSGLSGNNSRFSLSQTVDLVEDNKRQGSAGYKILIAEDNKVNTIVLTKLLQTLGYDTVDTAVNGKQAVDMAKDNRYDLILMDNHMPEMTGLEATQKLKQQHAIDAPIIACTADTSEQATQDFLDFGAQSVIYKPLKKALLSREIDAAKSGARAELAS